MKAVLIEHLQAKGHETVDLGTFDGVNKVDYPDIAREVGEKVLTIVGALLVFASHLINFRMCRQAKHCDCDA